MFATCLGFTPGQRPAAPGCEDAIGNHDDNAVAREHCGRRRLTRRMFLEQGSAATVGAVICARAAHASAITPWHSAPLPVLFHVSDAVQPGQPFSINGEWLDHEEIEVLLSTQNGSTPPADALKASILQVDDAGHFVVAVLPPKINSEIFCVLVKTRAGCSAPILLNSPRPLFLSQSEAWEEQKIQIVGRNFDPAEYGAKGNPRVRLVNGETIQEAVVVEHNPFAVTITIPRIDPSKYRMEIYGRKIVERASKRRTSYCSSRWERLHWNWAWHGLKTFSGIESSMLWTTGFPTPELPMLPYKFKR